MFHCMWRSQPTMCVQIIVLCLVAWFADCSGEDTAWMRSTLQQHFSDTRHHVIGATYKAQAKSFIESEFKSYGLDTTVQAFDTEQSTVKGYNVVGLSKGEHFNTDQDVVFGIIAHYDTVRTTKGVNDNGAGVVIMLAAAKELAKEKRNNTLMFVGVDFEEWETDSACTEISCGSRALVKDGFLQLWTSMPNIGGFYVLDTPMNINQTDGSQGLPFGFNIGFPSVAQSIQADGSEGDFILAIGRPYDSPLMTSFKAAYSAQSGAELEYEGINITSITGTTITAQDKIIYGDFVRSDHLRFWEKGYRAVFLTDSANFRGYMRVCYHNECDDMSHVTDESLMFLDKTSDALVTSLETLAPSFGTTSDAGTAYIGIHQVLITMASVFMAMAQMEM